MSRSCGNDYLCELKFSPDFDPSFASLYVSSLEDESVRFQVSRNEYMGDVRSFSVGIFVDGVVDCLRGPSVSIIRFLDAPPHYRVRVKGIHFSDYCVQGFLSRADQYE